MNLSEFDERRLELDLVRYMRKNRWNSRLVCKLINYKYGASYCLDDIDRIYRELIAKRSINTLINR